MDDPDKALFPYLISGVRWGFTKKLNRQDAFLSAKRY
jgi:hypothetical protein